MEGEGEGAEFTHYREYDTLSVLAMTVKDSPETTI